MTGDMNYCMDKGITGRLPLSEKAAPKSDDL